MSAQDVIAATTSSQGCALETQVVGTRVIALDAADTHARADVRAEHPSFTGPMYTVHARRSAVEALARTSREDRQRLADGLTVRIWYAARTGYHLDSAGGLDASAMTRLALAQ